MPTFNPSKPTREKMRNIKIEVTPAKYDELVKVADSHGISLKELVRQSVDFALENMNVRDE